LVGKIKEEGERDGDECGVVFKGPEKAFNGDIVLGG
jgi:hypothetical protein